MDASFERATDELWVFGYGSLIWRPGFEYVERVPARVVGLHRSLCVYSFDHRGTPERPGLVLGLDLGGACRGIAYRVAAKQRAATIAYLREREQTTAVYRELVRGIWLDGTPERRVDALCYVVDRSHVQYAGRLAHEHQLQLVRQAHGRSGNNRDYVIETVGALEALNIRDRDLHVLAERLKAGHDAHARAG
jgi:cation transport protein ChaC